VIDTNLLVAARWNKKSSSKKIIELCLEGVITPIYSKQIKDENLYILGKVKAPKEYLDDVLKFYQKGLKVEPKKKVTASKDYSDNRFLEAAIEGNADYVITNDSDLLILKKYEDVKIIRPKNFLRLMP
jgi:putative PIN family toxin of toxin-antitoxin system